MQAKMATWEQKLREIRGNIDRIDDKISGLLDERTREIDKIAKLKAEQEVEIEDLEREAEILAKSKTDFSKEVFKKILKESKKLQR